MMGLDGNYIPPPWLGDQGTAESVFMATEVSFILGTKAVSGKNDG
jgi:hypothetical protein